MEGHSEKLSKFVTIHGTNQLQYMGDGTHPQARSLTIPHLRRDTLASRGKPSSAVTG